MASLTRRTFFLALLLLSFCFSASHADVSLPSIFANHMVLQRELPIPVWGWAAPGEKILVTLSAAQVATAAAVADDAGNWQVTLPPQAAGGPFTLKIAGSNQLNFTDVLIGEVWLCSGQSNMDWNVGSCPNLDQEKQMAADNGHIRHFKVKHVAEGYPQKNLPGAWAVTTSESVFHFSAVAYFFARELSRELPGVPIGVLTSSWGGTRVEPWTPPLGFAQVPALKSLHDKLQLTNPASNTYQETLTNYLQALDEWRGMAAQALADQKPLIPAPAYPPNLIPGSDRQSPAALFNAMINPLIPYAFRGALWYQGESNLRDGLDYANKQLALVKGWRQLWQRDFPFYYVQLAPYRYGDGNQDSTVMGDFWEAQAICEEIPNSHMAVINDIGDVNDIHPRNKQEVGRRLSLLALAHTFGRTDLAYSGPKFKSMAITGNTLTITFDHAQGLTTRDGKTPDNFEIIGQGTDFLPATAKIDGEKIILSHPDIKEPLAMRFAWHKLSEPNLTNGAGLPCGSFRAGTVPEIDYFLINVPEAAEMTLVYDLDINKQTGGIVYDVDRADQIKSFSRVGYFLELQSKSQSLRYVYVSMDAFTDNPRLIGVPTKESGALFQTMVSNLTVVSNVKQIVNGTALENAGYIEFWPNNYGPKNEKGIPGASDTLFDFGDAIAVSKPDGYGCMQVHNIAAKQTIFAYNLWRSGQRSDLGIGNSPAGSGSAANTRDWTFNNNAESYTHKRLRVFVK